MGTVVRIYVFVVPWFVSVGRFHSQKILGDVLPFDNTLQLGDRRSVEPLSHLRDDGFGIVDIDDVRESLRQHERAQLTVAAAGVQDAARFFWRKLDRLRVRGRRFLSRCFVVVTAERRALQGCWPRVERFYRDLPARGLSRGPLEETPQLAKDAETPARGDDPIALFWFESVPASMASND